MIQFWLFELDTWPNCTFGWMFGRGNMFGPCSWFLGKPFPWIYLALQAKGKSNLIALEVATNWFFWHILSLWTRQTRHRWSQISSMSSRVEKVTAVVSLDALSWRIPNWALRGTWWFILSMRPQMSMTKRIWGMRPIGPIGQNFALDTMSKTFGTPSASLALSKFALHPWSSHSKQGHWGRVYAGLMSQPSNKSGVWTDEKQCTPTTFKHG